MFEQTSLIGSRAENQDLCRVFESHGRQLYVLADGVGGARYGRLAVEVTVNCFEKNYKSGISSSKLITDTLREAKKLLIDKGRNTGAAIVIACVEPYRKSYRMTYTWIGDSRLYVLTEKKWRLKKYKVAKDGNRCLSLLTSDDSVVFEYYRSGTISLDALPAHPYKNLLSYAFNEDRGCKDLDLLKNRVNSIYLSKGDKIFICTDGVWEQMRDQKEILMRLIDNRIGTLIEKRVSESTTADNASYIMSEVFCGFDKSS